MVKREACDDCIESTLVEELLQSDAPEDGPVRRLWVDRRDLVATLRQSQRELTAAAPDLEQARRRLGHVRADDGEEELGAPGHREPACSSSPSRTARTSPPTVSRT